jgi:flagellar biogenesis protein FliO
MLETFTSFMAAHQYLAILLAIAIFAFAVWLLMRFFHPTPPGGSG